MTISLALHRILKHRKSFLACATLVIAAFAVYWPILFNQFLLLWDDQWVVMNDYTEGGFDLYNLWAVLTEFYHGQYAPVNEFLYLTLYSVFGYNPFWFHLASLTIHIANILLIYIFINRLLLQTQSFEVISARRIAFFTALLLAVHPFLVEAVAWMSASKVLLYTLFYLVALLCYLKYIRNQRPIHYMLTLVFFIISFGAKEQAVVMPVCLLLIDYALKRDFRDKQVWLEKLPFCLLAMFFGVVTILSQGPINISGNTGYPIYQRIVFACYSLTEYVIKCLIPVKLSYIYPFPNQVGEALPLRFWIYPLIIIMLIVTLWNFWKKRWVFFGIVFFVIHLVVALHIISRSRFAIVPDRYVYLSSVGVFFVIAYFMDMAILRRIKYLVPLSLTGVLYIISIGSYAHTRTKVWHDTETIKKELRDLIKQRKNYNAKIIIKEKDDK